jgi:hypothetical protein
VTWNIVVVVVVGIMGLAVFAFSRCTFATPASGDAESGEFDSEVSELENPDFDEREDLWESVDESDVG